jgi:DHA2 family multidrug resistance protein-like MFS transporter
VVSVFAALSTSPQTLITSRTLLGIAGATLAPSTLSLTFSMFPDPRQRQVAIGIRAFNASMATNLLGIFIVVGYFLFVAQYLQLVLGLSPLAAGLWSLPSAFGFIIGSNLAPRILRRVRPAFVIVPVWAWRRSAWESSPRSVDLPTATSRSSPPPPLSSPSAWRRCSRRRPT